MKKQTLKILNTKRDSVSITAIYRARNVMMLLHGAKVNFGQQSGCLNLEKDVLRLTDALRALGIDPPFPVFE